MKKLSILLTLMSFTLSTQPICAVVFNSPSAAHRHLFDDTEYARQRLREADNRPAFAKIMDGVRSDAQQKAYEEGIAFDGWGRQNTWVEKHRNALRDQGQTPLPTLEDLGFQPFTDDLITQRVKMNRVLFRLRADNELRNLLETEEQVNRNMTLIRQMLLSRLMLAESYLMLFSRTLR